MHFDNSATHYLDQAQSQPEVQRESAFNSSLSLRSVSFVFPIENLDDDEYKLRERLLVLVESDSLGTWTAYYKPVNIYGFGDNIDEAIKELKGDLIDLHEDLQGTPSAELGQFPMAWKKHLNSIIRKI